MMTTGPRNLITDVPGLKVGNAADAVLNSGVTVLSAGAPFTAGISVMGGAPGTRETDLLAPDKTVQQVNALVLSGGSAFGLAAADGVSSALRAAGEGFAVGPHIVPIVPAAIIFDLGNGEQSWTDNPYPALGAAALKAQARSFELGSVGAGTGATTVNLKGVGPKINTNAAKTPTTKLHPSTATTIAIVATDAKLTKAQCTRMATAAQDGMARALWPSHTPMDGDLIFGVATDAKPLKDGIADTLNIGHAAALCLPPRQDQLLDPPSLRQPPVLVQKHRPLLRAHDAQHLNPVAFGPQDRALCFGLCRVKPQLGVHRQIKQRAQVRHGRDRHHPVHSRRLRIWQHARHRHPRYQMPACRMARQPQGAGKAMRQSARGKMRPIRL